jgi:hypothetical protein
MTVICRVDNQCDACMSRQYWYNHIFELMRNGGRLHTLLHWHKTTRMVCRNWSFHRFLVGPRGLANGFFSSPTIRFLESAVAGSSSLLMDSTSRSTGSDVSTRFVTTTLCCLSASKMTPVTLEEYSIRDLMGEVDGHV